MQIGGAAATGTVLNRYGLERRYNAHVDNYFNRRKDALKNSYGADPKGKPTGDPRKTAVPHAGARNAAKTVKRAKFTQLNNLGAAHNKASFHLGGNKQSYALAAVGAGGAALAYKGTRNKLSKAWTRKKADTAAGGAVAGAGAYQGATYAAKPFDRWNESKIKAGDTDPKAALEQRQTLAAHKAKVGLPKNAKLGDGRYREYFKTYPKELPGAKFKRITAVTHTGKTGVAATTAAGVAGASYALHRAKRSGAIGKSYQPWDGVQCEVSKMSPDPSAVHVPGSGGRTGRLRKIPRRVQGM